MLQTRPTSPGWHAEPAEVMEDDPSKEKKDSPEFRQIAGLEKASADLSDLDEGFDLLSEEMTKDFLGPESLTRCGLPFLQALACPGAYLVLSSLAAFVQGIFFTYSNAILSTIEKRFHLPSRISGFTTTGNDIVQLFFSIVISFIAGRSHRPRWLAAGMCLAGIGCFVAATPHFLFDGEGTTFQNQNILSNSVDHLCNVTSEPLSNSCKNLTREMSLQQQTVVACLVLGQMLGGFASMLYYTVGYSYLDEAATKTRVPIYLAMSGSLRILGPVSGYSLASWALNQWVNPAQSREAHYEWALHPRHPHWIGAWWIGYLVIGVTLLVMSWPLFLFPKMLPVTRRRKMLELMKVARMGPRALSAFVLTLRPSQSASFKGLASSLLRVARNPVYRLITLNQVFFWFSFFGYITFKPKYLEHQFRLSASAANRYIAVMALIATLLGWLGTGSVISFLKPSSRKVISFLAILSTLSCVAHLIQMSVDCKSDPIIGLPDSVADKTATQGNKTLAGFTHSWCSSGCLCSGRFSPVCAGRKTTFYNACYAGCQSTDWKNGSKVYRRCSCLDAEHYDRRKVPDSPEGTRLKEVLRGFCPSECGAAFTVYVVATILAKMVQAASRVPVNLILFRCVEERDKDVCLGLFNTAFALFSSIPAPIIFGWALDRSCLLWENVCSEAGFCWVYDIDRYRRILHGIPAVFLSLCVVTDVLLLRHHKTLDLYGSNNNNNK